MRAGKKFGPQLRIPNADIHARAHDLAWKSHTHLPRDVLSNVFSLVHGCRKCTLVAAAISCEMWKRLADKRWCRLAEKEGGGRGRDGDVIDGQLTAGRNPDGSSCTRLRARDTRGPEERHSRRVTRLSTKLQIQFGGQCLKYSEFVGIILQPGSRWLSCQALLHELSRAWGVQLLCLQIQREMCEGAG